MTTEENIAAAVRWGDEMDGLTVLIHNLTARPRTDRLRAARLARDLAAERATSARLADRVLELGAENERLREALLTARTALVDHLTVIDAAVSSPGLRAERT